MGGLSKLCGPHLTKYCNASSEGYIAFVALQHWRHTRKEDWVALTKENSAAAEFERLHHELSLENGFIKSRVRCAFSPNSLRVCALQLFLKGNIIYKADVKRELCKLLESGTWNSSSVVVCKCQMVLEKTLGKIAARKGKKAKLPPSMLCKLVDYDWESLSADIQSLSQGDSPLCGIHHRLTAVPCIKNYLSKLVLERLVSVNLSPRDWDAFVGNAGSHVVEAALDVKTDWSSRVARRALRAKVLAGIGDKRLLSQSVWTMFMTSAACQWMRLRARGGAMASAAQQGGCKRRLSRLQEGALEAQASNRARGVEAVRKIQQTLILVKR